MARVSPRRLSGVPRYRLSYPAAGVCESGYCSWEWETEAGRLIQRRRGYEINDQAFARVSLTTMPAHLADIIDVALAAYAIDRLSPRRMPGQRHEEQRWQRILEVCIPVCDLWGWENTRVISELERLLGYFTDDQWIFHFSQRQRTGRICELQGGLAFSPFDLRPAVCLFSGGLDSLSGAVGQLLRTPDLHIVCVAGSTSDWAGSLQASLVADLRRRFNGRATILKVPFNLALPEDGAWPEETSQRARGFVHLMLGAVGTLLSGNETLNVHENGVGALNLPYTGAEFGARMSKAMHPITLADAADWLSTYLGHPFRILGSALGLTKAQACQALVEADLGGLVAGSFSCDGFQRVAGQHQCGVCTSCLMRRQSIYAAGLSGFDNPELYRFDITNPDVAISDQHLAGLRLMLDQLTVLDRCLAADNPWRALVDAFPSLRELEARAADWQDVGGPDLPSTTLPSMYAAYLKEWEQFPICPSLRRGTTLGRAA